MLVDKILKQCADEGVHLALDGRELEVSFDDDISDALLELLKANKSTLIDYLLDHSQGAAPSFMSQAIAPVPAEQPQPLSFAQQRLWFIEQLEGPSAHYNLSAAFEFSGQLNIGIATEAINVIIQRHRVFQAVFSNEAGRPFQSNAQQHVFAFEELDYRQEANAAEDTLDAAKAALQAHLHQPFAIASDLLLSGCVIYTAQNQGLLAFNMHHIATDGWSIGLFVKEFVSLYRSLLAQQTPDLPSLPVQYIDFAAWQQQHLDQDALEPQLFYWQRQLSELPALHSLPLDYPRPAVQDLQGAVYQQHLGPQLSQQLQQLAQQQEVTPFILLHAALSCLLSRYSHQHDIVIGTPVANRRRPELEPLIGFFTNTLVLRLAVQGRFLDVLSSAKTVNLMAQEHQDVPFEMLVEKLAPERTASYLPLFQVMLAMNNTESVALELPDLQLQPLSKEAPFSRYDITVNVRGDAQAMVLEFEYATALFKPETIAAMAQSFNCLLQGIVADPEAKVATLPLLSAPQQAFIDGKLTGANEPLPESGLVHQLIEAQAVKAPDAEALAFSSATGQSQCLSYAELNQSANRLANHMLAQGLTPGGSVAVAVPRGIDMVVALLAVLKAGCHYIPLDPHYPAERLQYMMTDSGCGWVIADSTSTRDKIATSSPCCVLQDSQELLSKVSTHNPAIPVQSSQSLAYVIYTSGSTGQPKGVEISHANVLTFLQAMRSRLLNQQGVWLALTSISFDISVLEIFGALSQGFKVVVAPERSQNSDRIEIAKPLDFSLFYFGNDNAEDGAIYQLLQQGAAFADQHNFKAVWTPERHFAEFGGLYPNPALMGAALAATTEHIDIRAGSCVLPLHDPIEIAENWSVLDNLSQGRVGLAFASGWNPNDFALAPDAYQQRHEVLAQGIEEFKQLWQGQKLKRRNGVGDSIDVGIHPKPLQLLPKLWMTAAGSPETFRKAGEMGLNVLTHMLGQTFGELEQKIQIYRQAWQAAGHQGQGVVTLTLHTFVGETEEHTLAQAKTPFKRYLATSLNLLNAVRSEGQELDEEQVLEVAFNRYYKTATLLGSPERCRDIIQQVAKLDIDEISCLIDFGVPVAEAMASLERLERIKAQLTVASIDPISVEELVANHQATHMQCTPSWLANWLATLPEEANLASLKTLFVGGEAFSASLRQAIDKRCQDVQVYNMYGPTEATVWATSQLITQDAPVALGQPLANYRLYIVDAQQQLVPLGAQGELLISGPALARGYLGQPELSKNRFVANPFTQDLGFERLYHTGDLVRLSATGELLFLGRKDHQIKLRGFRIECGEIEAQLDKLPQIHSCAVVMKTDADEQQSLVAYVVPNTEQDSAEVHEGFANNIKGLLAVHLPSYMVPDWVVTLDALPKTHNGKIDRKNLPDPQQLHLDGQCYEAPQSDTERGLVGIWAELLKIEKEKISRQASFFDLGGHSLLLMRLVAQVQEQLGVTLSVREAFDAAILWELAQVVDSALQAQQAQAQYQQLTQPVDDSEEAFTI